MLSQLKLLGIYQRELSKNHGCAGAALEAVAEAAVKDAVGGDADECEKCVGTGVIQTKGFGIDAEFGACPACTRPQASAAVPEDAIDAVSKAMTKAWQLGQDYWRQADGDTQAEWDESGHTEVRFQTLLDETTSMLAASQPEVKS